MPQVLRSILAVLAGFVVLSVLRALGGLFTHALAGASSTLLVQAVWNLIAATASGFVCAFIAEKKPLQHAAVLAGLMLLAGLYASARLHGMYPAWYAALAVLGGPAAVLGGAAQFSRSVRGHAMAGK